MSQPIIRPTHTLQALLHYRRSQLSVFILILVIALVVARGDVVHPVLMVEIPFHGLLYLLLELQARLPAQLALKLAAGNGIAQVMSGSVCHIGDQLLALSLRIAQETVNSLDDHLDQVDVLPLVEAPYVVGLGHLRSMARA